MKCGYKMISNVKLHICKTICHECKKEYNTMYKTLEIDGKQLITELNDQDKIIAQENDIFIEKRAYGNLNNNPDIYVVNICPHCGAPFGNSHLKELAKSEIKEIKLR